MSKTETQKPARPKSLDELAIMEVVEKANNDFKTAYLSGIAELKERAEAMEISGSYQDRKAAKQIRRSMQIVQDIFKVAKEAILNLEDYANARRVESATLRARQLVADKYLLDTFGVLRELNEELAEMNGKKYADPKEPEAFKTNLDTLTDNADNDGDPWD